MANSAENKSFCEVPTYVIQGLTAKVDEIRGWIAKIDEINVIKKQNILKLKALRGYMNVT